MYIVLLNILILIMAYERLLFFITFIFALSFEIKGNRDKVRLFLKRHSCIHLITFEAYFYLKNYKVILAFSLVISYVRRIRSKNNYNSLYVGFGKNFNRYHSFSFY